MLNVKNLLEGLESCFFKLDADGEPVPTSMEDFGMFTHPLNHVACDEGVVNGKTLRISTIFTGILWPSDPSSLWETMVFVDGHAVESERCSGKRKDAMAMHLRFLDKYTK